MTLATMNCGIYRIRNLINNHCYIGQSCDLKKRKSKHFSMLRKNIHDNRYLQRAWNKYGEENFSFEILLICEKEKNILSYYEQSFVDFFAPEYNLRKKCIDSNIGIKYSEESKKKMSERQQGEKSALYGKHLSESHKNNISNSLRGEKNYLFGKHLSDETKKKMSESLRGRIISDETRKKMSDALSGEKNPNFGKLASEESRAKMSESHKGEKNPNFGKKLSEEHRNNISRSLIGKKQNKESSNSHVGVTYNKRFSKWQVRITYNRKRISYGYFLTEEEAIEIYENKYAELYGDNK